MREKRQKDGEKRKGQRGRVAVVDLGCYRAWMSSSSTVRGDGSGASALLAVQRGVESEGEWREWCGWLRGLGVTFYSRGAAHGGPGVASELGSGRCNTPTHPRAGPVTPGSSVGSLDWPQKPTLVFFAHFVLTRAHPGRTSRSVTHPQITPGQARLTSEFLANELPKKKLQLVDMSIQSY